MLKLTACILMLIDHIGYFFYNMLPPELVLMLRAAGRLAFPLFAFSVALGFRRTRSPLRYLIRMLIFGLLTEGILRATAAWTGFEFPVNVLFTFATAILFLIGYETALRSYWDMVATMRLARSATGSPGVSDYNVRIELGETGLSPTVGFPLGILLCATAVMGNLALAPDYGLYGLITIWIFYLTAARLHTEPDKSDPSQLKSLRTRTWIGISAVNFMFVPIRVLIENVNYEWAILQLLSLLAIPMILNGRKEPRPGIVLRYGFYLFYPLHIALLMILSHLLQG